MKKIQYNVGNPTYMDQGAAGLPKTTDYWKMSEQIYQVALQKYRSFRIDYHVTEFIIIY
jgi:hypothetical protein